MQKNKSRWCKKWSQKFQLFLICCLKVQDKLLDTTRPVKICFSRLHQWHFGYWFKALLFYKITIYKIQPWWLSSLGCQLSHSVVNVLFRLIAFERLPLVHTKIFRWQIQFFCNFSQFFFHFCLKILICVLVSYFLKMTKLKGQKMFLICNQCKKDPLADWNTQQLLYKNVKT